MSGGGPHRVGWLRGWRLLGVLALALILLTVSVGLWWYYDSGDLDAIRVEARRQGQPATWEEMGLQQADEARLALWKRITALAKNLKTYQSRPDFDTDGSPPFKLFAPIPDKLRTIHAALDAANVEELMDLLDQLGDQPLVLRKEMDHSSLFPEIGTHRVLTRFLLERVALADTTEVPRLCRRMLVLCRCYSADCLIQHYVHCSLVENALTAVTSCLTDLKRVEPAIADDVLATTKDLPAELIHALQGEFLSSMAMVTQRNSINVDGSSPKWFRPVVVRLGRYTMLNAQLEGLSQLHRRDLAGFISWAQADEAALTAEQTGVSICKISAARLASK